MDKKSRLTKEELENEDEKLVLCSEIMKILQDIYAHYVNANVLLVP